MAAEYLTPWLSLSHYAVVPQYMVLGLLACPYKEWQSIYSMSCPAATVPLLAACAVLLWYVQETQSILCTCYLSYVLLAVLCPT